MAEAKKTTTTVVTLTLSEEETQVLTDVLANISGNRTMTRRKHTESIYTALRLQGFNFTPAGQQDYTGTLTFKETN